jgi:excisionase family DNA binding protein
MPTSKTMSVREAARRLGVSMKQVYNLLWDGRLNGQKIDGQWCVSAGDVQDRLTARAK